MTARFSFLLEEESGSSILKNPPIDHYFNRFYDLHS